MAATMQTKVYIDFDNDGSFATAGDDITAYVKSMQCKGGFDDELQHTASGGRATITLNNADRRFSPAYTAGTYYGKLLPFLPLKIDLTDGVTTWTAFRGYTEAWEPESGEHGRRECRLSGIDEISRLQDIDVAIPLQEAETADVIIKKVVATARGGGVADLELEFLDLPADNDTITIGDRTYTLVDSPSSADEVRRYDSSSWGNVVHEAGYNLAHAINADTGSGSRYGAGTTRHADVTARGYTGWRIDPDDTDTDLLLQETTDSYEKLAGSFYFLLAAYHLPDGTTSCDHIWLRLKKTGTPAGTLTVRIEGSYNTTPSGILVDNNATGTYDEADLSTSYAWHRIDFAGSVEFEHFRRYWVVLSTDRAASGANYVAWGAASDASAILKLWKDYDGSSWTAHTNAAPVMAVPDRCIITANAAGTWGNSLTVSADSDGYAFDGVSQEGDATPSTTLAGGSDPLTGSYQAGQQTLDIAGDTWPGEGVNAHRAIQDVIDSEFGYCWVARDGTFTVKNRDWQFTQQSTAASLTLSSEHNALRVRLTADDVYNYIIVTYTPRREASSGIVARVNAPITVSPNAGQINWDVTDDIETRQNVVNVPFVEAATGNIVGAKDLITPVAGTDYNVYTNVDGTGSTYNDDVIVSLGITGGKVRAAFKNKSGADRYIHDFQVRGVAIIAYERQQIVRRNAASIAAYGKRAYNYTLPFASTYSYAETIAEYLQRYADAVTRFDQLTFNAQYEVDGTNIFSLDIGDLITVTDAQTGITSQNALIWGYQYDWTPGRATRTTITVRAIGDKSYWILADATFSNLGNTTRLAMGDGWSLLAGKTWAADDLVGAADMNSMRDDLAHLYANMPARWTCWHDESTVTAGNAITSVTDTSQRHNTVSYQDAAAQNDEFTQGAWLKRGNYSFGYTAISDSDGGIADCYIDDILFDQIDLYSAAKTNNVTETKGGLFIEDAGWHVLKVKAATKNGSSSGYKLQFTQFWLEPIAD